MLCCVVLQSAAGGVDSDGDSDAADDLADLDSDEREDYVLRESDLLILAARNEDDVSTIEVWVYEEASSSTGERSGLGRSIYMLKLALGCMVGPGVLVVL